MTNQITQREVTINSCWGESLRSICLDYCDRLEALAIITWLRAQEESDIDNSVEYLDLENKQNDVHVPTQPCDAFDSISWKCCLNQFHRRCTYHARAG